MLRIVLTYLLPFLAPATLFVVWVWLRARYVERHGGEPPEIEKGVWFWLFLAGGILVLITMGVTAFVTSGGRPGDVYVPPKVIDGKVVPGGFRKETGAGGGGG